MGKTLSKVFTNLTTSKVTPVPTEEAPTDTPAQQPAKIEFILDQSLHSAEEESSGHPREEISVKYNAESSLIFINQDVGGEMGRGNSFRRALKTLQGNKTEKNEEEHENLDRESADMNSEFQQIELNDDEEQHPGEGGEETHGDGETDAMAAGSSKEFVASKKKMSRTRSLKNALKKFQDKLDERKPEDKKYDSYDCLNTANDPQPGSSKLEGPAAQTEDELRPMTKVFVEKPRHRRVNTWGARTTHTVDSSAKDNMPKDDLAIKETRYASVSTKDLTKKLLVDSVKKVTDDIGRSGRVRKTKSATGSMFFMAVE